MKSDSRSQSLTLPLSHTQTVWWPRAPSRRAYQQTCCVWSGCRSAGLRPQSQLASLLPAQTTARWQLWESKNIKSKCSIFCLWIQFLLYDWLLVLGLSFFYILKMTKELKDLFLIDIFHFGFKLMNKNQRQTSVCWVLYSNSTNTHCVPSNFQQKPHLKLPCNSLHFHYNLN